MVPAVHGRQIGLWKRSTKRNEHGLTTGTHLSSHDYFHFVLSV